MTWTVSQLASYDEGSGAGNVISKTTASLSIPAGGMVVVHCGGSDGAVAAWGSKVISVTNSAGADGTGGWTAVDVLQNPSNAGVSFQGGQAFYKLFASGGSYTITVAVNTGTVYWGYEIDLLTSNVGTPTFVQGKGAGTMWNDAGNGHSQAVTLSAAPTSGNLVWAAEQSNNDATAAASTPTGFTVIAAPSAQFEKASSWYHTSTTTATVTIGDLGDQIEAVTMFVAEFSEGGAAAPGPGSFAFAPRVGPGAVGDMAFQWQPLPPGNPTSPITLMTLTGGITPAGALIKAVSKPLTGGITPAGALAKLVANSLVGSITPTGALTTTKVVLRSFSGNVGPSGSLLKLVAKPLGGGITPTGALRKDVTKPLTGGITPTGGLAKLVAKALAGGITPGPGTLTTTKVALKSLSGAITPTGNLLKQVNKALAGGITPTGALVKQAQKNLTGSITPTGSLVKAVTKLLAGSITPGPGTMTYTLVTLRSFSGAITPTGALSKSVSKALAGAITPSGAVRRSVFKGLAGGLTPTGALAKLISKPLAGSITPGPGTLTSTKVILRTFTGTIGSAGALTRLVGKGLGGTITPGPGSLRRTTSKGLGGTLTPTGGLAKAVTKKLTGTILPTGIVTTLRVIRKTLTGVIGSFGTLTMTTVASPRPDVFSELVTRAVDRIRRTHALDLVRLTIGGDNRVTRALDTARATLAAGYDRARRTKLQE